MLKELPPQEYIDAVGGGDFVAIGGHLFDVIRERASVQPTDHILDIGSGCGRLAAPFADYLTTGRYDGFDVVLPMVEWCRENITRLRPEFQFHHAQLKNTLYSGLGGDASSYKFPFPANMFDVVFATSVFTHLMPESALQYASEVARVLKPTGRAFLTFFILNDAWRAKKAAGADVIPFPFNHGDYSVQDDANPEAVIAYEEPVARRILESGGLTINELSLGKWSKNNGWTTQDVFLLGKRPPTLMRLSYSVVRSAVRRLADWGPPAQPPAAPIRRIMESAGKGITPPVGYGS